MDKAGETEVEGGDAGCSVSPDPDPKLARRLFHVRILPAKLEQHVTYLNAFADVADSFSFC